MRQILLILIFPMVFLANSCKKGPDYLRSYGNETTEIRQMGHIDEIRAGEKFRIQITQDTSAPESVTIIYGSNVIDGITTSLNNGILEIKDDNHFNWVRNLDVHPKCIINVHNLTKIVANGSAEFTCLDTLKVTDFDFKMNSVGEQIIWVFCGQVHGGCTNSGHVLFQGFAGIFAWSCEQGGWIDASKMITGDAYIYHYTNRNIYVNPGTIFKAFVYAKGNVYYYREPWLEFDAEVYGEGKVIKIQ